MSSSSSLTRREAIRYAAVSALTVPLLGPRSLRAAETISVSPAGATADRTCGLKLSVATISLRDLPIAIVAAVLKQLEIGYASLYRTHAPFESGSADVCRAAAETLRAAGIAVASSSVVNLPNDEAAVRQAFGNARAAGLSLMTCRPAPDAFPLLERCVKEFGIRLAIHNHGPEDNTYASPYDVLKRIDALDPGIGLCLDVGHTMRARVDPAEAIRRCAGRLYDFHLKDSLAVPGAAEDIPVEVGRGRLDIRSILAALVEVKYAGVVGFEYERLGVNPVTGLAESIGYVRGMLAAMAHGSHPAAASV